MTDGSTIRLVEYDGDGGRYEYDRRIPWRRYGPHHPDRPEPDHTLRYTDGTGEEEESA